MDKNAAKELVRETFQNPFDKDRFYRFTKELLNHFEDAHFLYRGNLVPDAYDPFIQTLERLGKYQDPDGNKIDILIVKLKKESSLEHARTMQRNFIGWYLGGSRGDVLKDAALVAFVAPDEENWRFSLVKMEYKITETPSGKVKAKEEFTPAKRYSFIVGKNETTHTAQSRLVSILEDDEHDPTLDRITEAFNIEKVTAEFFEKYKELFLKVKETIDALVEKDKAIKKDFEAKSVNIVDFSKKLLGQIVFLYFLQKKGWFGVPRGKDWGDGDKQFLRHLFEKAQKENKNYFNKFLEPLFYEALRLERPKDYYDQFDCRIPFLNGGLFDPINEYDWQDTDIIISNDLFSNQIKDPKTGDVGTGILDVFDRYNFTVKEDEPLEKEVAVDPEMLGKVFENLLEVKDRKSKGTYYTPREIVHYMCQESLSNYLSTELAGKVSKEDIETLIKYGETAVEHDATYIKKKSQNKNHNGRYGKAKLPKDIEKNSELIDEKLEAIRVCDPAVGSGAFPVGMMNEIVRTRNALTPHLSKNGERTPYNFKRHAIQNCLYGVDIDPGAVEICKLRLWLSLIVDEEDIKQIKPLPNLDYKVVQGDSLSSITKDLFNQPFFAKLEELKPLFFNETNARQKQKYKDQINDLIQKLTNNNRSFDFNIYFSEVFHDHGREGFNIIITNPPYVEGRQLDDRELKILKERYFSAQGKVNLFNTFQERAYQILKEGGISTFIIPVTFLRNSRYWAIRQFLLERTKFLQIITFDEMQFKHAVVESIVTLVQKTKTDKSKFLVFNNLYHKEPTEFLQDQFLTQSDYRILIGGGTEESSIVSGVKEQSMKLEDVYEVKDGISTGFKPFPEILLGKKVGNKFVSLNGEAGTFDPAIHKKVIDGGEFNKYTSIKWEERYIKYDKLIEQNPRPPKGHPFNCQLREREIFETKPRILSRQTSNRLIMTLDEDGFYTRNSIHNIYPKGKGGDLNIKYVLSLLNSSLMNFVYTQSTQETGKVHPQVHISDLRQLPIKKASASEQRPFIEFVDKIRAITEEEDYLQNSTKQTRVADYEKQIDQLVYKFYGLTPEEIKIVEESIKHK